MCQFVQYHTSKRLNFQRLAVFKHHCRGTFMGTPMEYNLGLIVQELLSSNHREFSTLVECTVI